MKSSKVILLFCFISVCCINVSQGSDTSDELLMFMPAMISNSGEVVLSQSKGTLNANQSIVVGDHLTISNGYTQINYSAKVVNSKTIKTDFLSTASILQPRTTLNYEFIISVTPPANSNYIFIDLFINNLPAEFTNNIKPGQDIQAFVNLPDADGGTRYTFLYTETVDSNKIKIPLYLGPYGLACPVDSNGNIELKIVISSMDGSSSSSMRALTTPINSPEEVIPYFGNKIASPIVNYRICPGNGAAPNDDLQCSGSGFMARSANTRHWAVDMLPQEFCDNCDFVYPIAGGKIIEAHQQPCGGSDHCYGKIVSIDHMNGFISRYAHLDSYNVPDTNPLSPPKNPTIISSICDNKPIGKMGMTGRTPGPNTRYPHLHFELIRVGKCNKDTGNWCQEKNGSALPFANGPHFDFNSIYGSTYPYFYPSYANRTVDTTSLNNVPFQNGIYYFNFTGTNYCNHTINDTPLIAYDLVNNCRDSNGNRNVLKSGYAPISITTSNTSINNFTGTLGIDSSILNYTITNWNDASQVCRADVGLVFRSECSESPDLFYNKYNNNYSNITFNNNSSSLSAQLVGRIVRVTWSLGFPYNSIGASGYLNCRLKGSSFSWTTCRVSSPSYHAGTVSGTMDINNLFDSNYEYNGTITVVYGPKSMDINVNVN